ncbi:MAG: hypothetical protein QOH88_3576 [Verrucomicrobiota bacterium]|jgi:exosortase
MLLGAFALLWFILCRHLSSEWSLNEQYNYGWFVPFFAAYLFWLRFEEMQNGAGLPSGREGEAGDQAAGNVQGLDVRGQTGELRGWRALVISAAALALLLLFPVRLFEVANPDWRPLGWVHAFAVIAITFAALYLLGGWKWTRHFSFPILFFLVAVPWISAVEAPIVQGLMRGIAALAAETVSLLGIPAQVQGNLIRIASGVVGVNEACSGVRSLQTSLMIGLLLGELKRLSLWSRVVLVAGAVAIALIDNFFRAVFLVWMAATRDIAAVDRWHDFAGYAIVAAVFAGSLALAALLAPRASKQRSEVRSQRSEGKIPTADVRPPTASPFLLSNFYFLLSLAWLFAIEAGVEFWYRAHERNLMPRTTWTVHTPEKAAGLREIKIDEGVRQTLRYDTGRELVWKTTDPMAPETPTTNYLYYFRWNPGSSSVVRARAHRPDICLPGAGWNLLAEYGTKIYRSRDGIELPARHVSFRQENGSAVVHTFFCLQEDKIHPDEARPDLQLAEGVQPDWSMTARTRTVRNGVRNLGQQVLEVVFLTSHPIEDEAAEQRFGELVRDLIVADERSRK